MFDRLQFLVSEAFIALRRNGLMTVAAVSTVAVSLFLVGGLGYVYFKLSAFAETLPSKFDVMVYLKDGTKPPQISQTAKEIRGMNGISEAIWMPKEREWQKKKLADPEHTQYLDNPYPDALKVKLAKLDGADDIIQHIKSLGTVMEVEYDAESQQAVQGMLVVLRWLGAVLGGLLFLTGGILIHNAIRLTIIVRRREIRIMQLVGASQIIVCTPFLIEGVLQGVLGGVLADVLIWAANNVFVRYAVENMHLNPKTALFPVWPVLGGLCAIGAMYGLFCSVLATREPLKLR